MVLASPQLGRSNNHPPLSRYPICSNSSTPTESAFLASQYVPSNGHASSIFFSNQNSLKANYCDNTSRDGATMQAHTTPYMKTPTENMDNCWTNLFNSNSNHLSNSTPVLNTTENGLRQHLHCGQLTNAAKMRSPPRTLNGMGHQLVSPSFSSNDFSDANQAYWAAIQMPRPTIH
uniref:Uncharacterized protein n=1 Tax=Ditylenchus dipsaci TaxID=166011 RepID=A0A915CN33_9BILA